jgi:hypothetical protein
MSMPTTESAPGCKTQTGLFSPETLAEHGLCKKPLWEHLRGTRLPVILSLPLIYGCVVPFFLLDVSVAIYQLICFPIYGIPKAQRRDYMFFDRGRLAYLNAIEKVGCVYCSYANGLLAYIAEIAGRTEQYFCPIKHAADVTPAHSRYANFLPYGDAQAYRARSEEICRDFGDLQQ